MCMPDIWEWINDDKIEDTKKHGPFNVYNGMLHIIIYRYNAGYNILTTLDDFFYKLLKN